MFRRSLCFWKTVSREKWTLIQDTPRFDLCVIGGGPSGIAAALRAVDYNKRVCLIECNRLGGADIWNGTLQSKTLWEMSNFLARANGAPAERVYAKKISEYMELDEEAIQKSLKYVSTIRQNQVDTALKAAGVVQFNGKAYFSTPNDVQIHNRESNEYRCVSADYFIIAAGSKPKQHPFVKVDGKRVVTSDEIMCMPLPKSMVIVGAGVIGCEFASIFARLGVTKVSIIDKAPHILPRMDKDFVHRVEAQLKQHGVLIHHESMLYDLQNWEEDDDEMAEHPEDPTRHSGVQYTIMNRATKELETFNVERALVAVGREPCLIGMGIDNTKCKTRDGKLVLNEFGRSINVEHIYAVGDVSSKMQLVGMAEAEALVAVDHIYATAKASKPQLEESMATVMFLTSIVSGVGLNEKECRKRDIAYVAVSYGYELISRAIAAGSTDGFVKIIVSNDSKKEILGIHAMGFDSCVLVDLGSRAIQHKKTAYDLAGMLTAYPSVSQAFQECLRVILGQSALKVDCFPGLKVTKWMPLFYERGAVYQKEMMQSASLSEASQSST